jgi:hypothetical protein
MSDLREQFEKETQNQAIYRKFGIDYHTLKYVKWLESQLTQLQSKWNKLNTRPNDAKAMIAEGLKKIITSIDPNDWNYDYKFLQSISDHKDNHEGVSMEGINDVLNILFSVCKQSPTNP